jgi:hypothetical protein
MRHLIDLKGGARMREFDRHDAWLSQQGLERADFWADREIVMRRDLQEGIGRRRFHAIAKDGKAITGRSIGEEPEQDWRYGLCSAIVTPTGRTWSIELDKDGWPTGHGSAIDPWYDPSSYWARLQCVEPDDPDAGRLPYCYHCMRLMWQAP